MEHDRQAAITPPTPIEAKYLAVQRSEEFQDLRRRYRGWVIPVTVGSLLWYLAYVLLAAYAADFMGTPLFGNINVGLVLGLLQFVSTFAVTALYLRYASRVLDPASLKIREKMEEEGLL
ncbi:DUF485 domain-containing protein [Pengzhenrongella frigida]|uniref:DUF485 domain-containing protein n=1 Tax=Pengzhenrongella frigida TaxID=1259133 RepID=A0A4Q5N296_9MICO|nr:DUF485 domain-containing protein [Cellulomonas sp. HLT2-17]RYV52298.1 DUF485 domain-containing protein [Cellulomonas sp. HLT2-17]